MYQTATQWILGVRPTYAGLRVDPQLPGSWESLEVTRKFRGTTYHIVLEQDQGIQSPVTIFEGKVLENTSVIPWAAEGKTVEVQVRIPAKPERVAVPKTKEAVLAVPTPA